MANTEEIPKPDESGVSGSQLPGSDVAIVEPKGALSGLPITRQLEGLAAARSRAFGGEVSVAFVLGTTRQLASDLEAARAELKERDKKLETNRDELVQANQDNAVLRSQLRHTRQAAKLGKLCVFFGTALAGIAIDQISGSNLAIGVVLGIFGVVLIASGAFFGRQEKLR